MATDGVLLLNLGSPAAPTRGAVRRYLAEFLTDKYVLDIPTPLRYALVHGLITPFRSGKSAKAYASIWNEHGSPLIHITRTFAGRVQEQIGRDTEVRWAMCYGMPAVRDVVRGWKVRRLRIVPLYPQYAESSTRSVVEKALKYVRQEKVAEDVQVLQDFYGEEEFIHSQTLQILKHMEGFAPDHLLLSFHGLPEHHMTKLHDSHCLVQNTCCDTVTEKNRLCYRAQCMFTAAALRNRLPLSAAKVKVSFQSRLGRRPWIKPYTDHLVTELAKNGCKRLLVSCPSFVADCLETLEEIAIRLREQFLSEGGEELKLVPALNFEDHWIENFVRMIGREDLPWIGARQRSHFVGL